MDVLIVVSCIIYLVIKAQNDGLSQQAASFVVLDYMKLLWLVENEIIATTLFYIVVLRMTLTICESVC